MYTAFYGLKEKPFALSPDPKYLFLSEAHREALAHLLYGIEQGEGFIAVTGEVGTGKTTLCRTLLQRLGSDTEVAFIFNPELDAFELLQTISTELGMEAAGRSRRELVEQLNRFLVRKREEGRRVLLIIDEAQNLPLETLEQIRLLSNLETETSKLIQILLLGQPELDTKLDLPELRQLKQRITVRWRLEPLTQAETRSYVRHRLRIAAGAERDLFTTPALREVHKASRGIPRLVNVLCDRVLLAGYASQRQEIGAGLVSEVEREVRGPGGMRSAGAGRQALLVASLLLGAAALGLIAVLVWRLTDRMGAEPPAPVAVLGEPAPAAVSPPAPAVQPAPRVAAPTQAPARRATPPAPAGRPPVATRPSAAAQPDAPARTASLPGTTAPRATTPVQPSRPPDAAASGVAPTAATPATDRRASDPVQAARAPARSARPALAVPATAGDFADLSASLTAATPADTASRAVDAVLEAWGLPPEALQASSVRQALDVLRARGLSVARVPGASPALLRALNHPAILTIRAPDGVPRYLAVGGMNAYDLTVVGVPPAPVSVRAQELLTQGAGDVYVVWRDFEGLPEVLGPWNKGAPVLWLQRSLRALGHYDQPPSGDFDRATIEAVRAFQESLRLEVDGTVGPLTKMALYGSISDYAIPRLRADGELG